MSDLEQQDGNRGGNVPLVLVIYEDESIGVLPGTIRENKRYWVSGRDVPNIEGGVTPAVVVIEDDDIPKEQKSKIEG